MLFKSSRFACALSGGSFHSAPPSSRPPTKAYDRQSFVLVVDESDEALKFMKMHLNRYFSHVVVARSAADGVGFLKQKEFDLIIAEAAPSRKANADFLKKVAGHWRGVPVILTSSSPQDELSPTDIQNILIVDTIAKPFEMDALHIAIRRALNARASLKELDALLPSKTPLGSVIAASTYVTTNEKVLHLIENIRSCLQDEFVD